MKSKIFFVLLINIAWVLFPQNIIGCADGPDPKDYYTSFFSNAHVADQTFRPFFYTALTRFYDDFDWLTEAESAPPKGQDPIIEEWKQYAGNSIPETQVTDLVYAAPVQVVQYLIDKSDGKKVNPPAAYDSFRNNLMVRALMVPSKMQALPYLLLAKQVQQLTYSPDPWEAQPAKDSMALVKLFQQAEMERSKANDSFLKTRYAFMQCRIAFYAGNYPLCIRMVDTHFGEGAPLNAAKPMAISYKAGSYFKTGKEDEAALWFARAFKLSPRNRKPNFLGFYWSTRNSDSMLQPEIMAKTNDNREKALIAALFSLHGLAYGLENMKLMYRLDPSNDMLPVIAVRELKKLEENYLSPVLAAQSGAEGYFYLAEEKPKINHLQHAAKVLAFFEQLVADNRVPQNDLFRMAAAYTAYIKGDYVKASRLSEEISKGTLPASSQKQALLIQLLAKAGSFKVLNAEAERELLPLVQTLYTAAESEVDYRIFLRNFFSQVLAPRYFMQKEIHKTALCRGIANLAKMPELKEAEQYYYLNFGEPAIDYVRNEFSTEQAVQLYHFLKKDNLSAFERFLVEKTSFHADEVTDFIGTSYLRDHNWSVAIEWLEKAENREKLIGYAFNDKTYEYDSVFVNPFHDYINDWQRYDMPLSAPLEKAALARKMINLEKQLDTTTNRAQKGKTAYLLGTAYYNLSYYGNAWMALDYGRSTHLWNNGKQTGWRKEYFEVQKARKYYQLAYELSGANKEFQAAAFFLVTKCAQRQIPRPEYDYDNWKAADKAEKEFERKFRNNPLFPQFKKEFGQTKYYRYALSRCSYLADFDKRK